MYRSIKISALLFLIMLFCGIAHSQNEKRFNIEMSFSYNGKSIKTLLSSASYNINREVYEADSPSSQKKYIYFSVVPTKLDKELLSAIKDKKAVYDILITMSDSYGKEPKRETLLKKASLSSISESYSNYNYDYTGNANLTLIAEAIVLDGVEFLP